MNTLPQGLPRDTRNIVQRLRNTPRHGGPPPSGPGTHPNEPRDSPFGMPLPNFENLYRDNMPCHISDTNLYDRVLSRIQDPSNRLPLLNRTTLRVQKPWKELSDMSILHYFAGQQPLTVVPLANGANILQAPRGSVEFGFRNAFQWYSRYLEWLHYEDINDERVGRLVQLRDRLQHWQAQQCESAHFKPSPVNGLFPIPPVLQNWIWPWVFFLVWQIREELLVDDNSAVLPSLDLSLQLLNKLVYAGYHFERKLLDEDGTALFMPEDRFIPVLNFEDEETQLQNWTTAEVDDIIREINRLANRVFEVKALRHWGFKRPWRQLWLVFNPQDVTEVEEDQHMLERRIIEVQQHLHADAHGSQLLTFHPLLASELNDKADSCPLAQCGGEPWKTNDQVMETVCGHIACVDCMVGYWESHVRGLGGLTAEDWPCPFCRQSPGRLRSKLQIAHTLGMGSEFDKIADAETI
ncbi:hypothetical protein MMC08_002963 [Hypocenomyce scalaris]|nr:hypothetical protein [Hypocenomyce scalaris]